jgi:hypothetical protein
MAWSGHIDCRSKVGCNENHLICIADEDQNDDVSTYAFNCPKTGGEIKFRWNHAGFSQNDGKCPPGSISAYPTTP